MPVRNQVGAMEKLLCNCLKDAGYKVMNDVRWRFELSGDDAVEKWRIAREHFQKEFPKLRKSESPLNSCAGGSSVNSMPSTAEKQHRVKAPGEWQS